MHVSSAWLHLGHARRRQATLGKLENRLLAEAVRPDLVPGNAACDPGAKEA
jgi:hypothetical protein